MIDFVSTSSENQSHAIPECDKQGKYLSTVLHPMPNNFSVLYMSGKVITLPSSCLFPSRHECYAYLKH